MTMPNKECWCVIPNLGRAGTSVKNNTVT